MIRYWLLIAIALAVGNPVTAQDTGNAMPAKPATTCPPNVPDPARQAGDTLETATVIPSLPFTDAGTTTGFHDDYAGSCIFDNGAPDVVYQLLVPAGVAALDISLCGSPYDTGLYVLDAGLVEIACNDDACGLQSRLEAVAVSSGDLYYVVVDGYSNLHGNYTLHVEEYVPCLLECPPDAAPEGEPPLVDDYVDYWNGGCNTYPQRPFQSIWGDGAGEFVLCGVSGWYLTNGQIARDTDWYHLHVGAAGAVEVTAEAEQRSYLFELHHDCSVLGIPQQALVEDCLPVSMTTVMEYAPGDVVWLWIGPAVFSTPPGADHEYDYVVWFSGLEAAAATAQTTWGTVKALYQ
jgi:hypothetical protein